jgi:hypothetical protein
MISIRCSAHHFAGFHLLDDLLEPIHGAFEI